MSINKLQVDSTLEAVKAVLRGRYGTDTGGDVQALVTITNVVTGLVLADDSNVAGRNIVVNKVVREILKG